MDLDAESALRLAEEVARWAAGIIRSTRPARIHLKDSPADLVTDVDVAIEREVRRRIGLAFPDHGIHGEELGAPPEPRPCTWFLDPIDGTTNYVSGLPWACFSLALADTDGPLVGVVADPFRSEIFSAMRAGGAFVDGARVRCPEVASLAGAVVLTELVGHLPWPGMADVLAALAGDHATTRIMGSTALTLASAGVGRAAAAILAAHDDIDDMAGLLIAREAGAEVRGRRGSSHLSVEGVLVAAPGVVNRVVQLWG